MSNFYVPTPDSRPRYNGVNPEHLDDSGPSYYSLAFYKTSVWASKYDLFIVTLIFAVWSILSAWFDLHFTNMLKTSFVGVLLALMTYLIHSLVSDNFSLYRRFFIEYSMALSKMKNFVVIITGTVKNTAEKANVSAHMMLLSDMMRASVYTLKHKLRGDFDINKLPISPGARSMIEKRLCNHPNLRGLNANEVFADMCDDATDMCIVAILSDMAEVKELKPDFLFLAMQELKKFSNISDDLDVLKKTKPLPIRTELIKIGLFIFFNLMASELYENYGFLWGYLAIMLVAVFYFGAENASEMMSRMWTKNNVYASNGNFNISTLTHRVMFTNECMFEIWEHSQELGTQMNEVMHLLAIN